MDKICKWSVRYNGDSCALGFIGRVEQLCEVNELPLDIKSRIIMKLLSGQVTIWYRNSKHSWTGWQEFKQEFLKFFLHTRYLERLDNKVRQTLQLEGEKFKDYALRLQDMMRHLNYTIRQQLERICRNSRREYQLFFGNMVCENLNEMISLGERFEDISAPTMASPPRETSCPSRVPRVNAPIATNTSINVCLRYA